MMNYNANEPCWDCDMNDLCPAFAIFTDEQKDQKHDCCVIEQQDEPDDFIDDDLF